MRRIAVLDAPSNLGLRPPTATSVPGCAKAPGALRDQGLLTRLDARDAGCLTPPRYDPGDWRPGDGVAHARQIAAYSRALADRIGAILDAGEFPVILGGDCSILLGSGLAMHRLGEAVGGRIGLVFVDGHSDFRHPGNASYVGAAAGEDLALVTGRGQADLAAIESRRPYFRDVDVVVMGIRAQDEYRLDLQAAGIVTRPVPALRAEGAARSAQWAQDQLTDCAGYWVHVDVDVLDPAVMPAVDAPSPGGIAFPELELLLAGLVESPHCLGVELTVFDPDYDTDGAYAEEITSAVVAGMANAHTVTPRPDLIAARADFNEDDEARRERRVEAAAESVTLAAEGASAGPEATTMLGVEVADEVPAVDGETAEFPPEDDDDYARACGETDYEPVGDERGDGGTDHARADFERAGRETDYEQADYERGDRYARARDERGDEESGYARVLDERGDRESGYARAGDERGDAEADYARAGHDVDHARVRDDVDYEQADEAGDEADDERGDEADDERGDEADDEPDVDDGPEPPEPTDRLGETDEPDPARPARRPLGAAPLLDSEPLPATRPGMLRPRSAEDTGVSLPAQRPSYDWGPADIA